MMGRSEAVVVDDSGLQRIMMCRAVAATCPFPWRERWWWNTLEAMWVKECEDVHSPMLEEGYKEAWNHSGQVVPTWGVVDDVKINHKLFEYFVGRMLRSWEASNSALEYVINMLCILTSPNRKVRCFSSRSHSDRSRMIMALIFRDSWKITCCPSFSRHSANGTSTPPWPATSKVDYVWRKSQQRFLVLQPSVYTISSTAVPETCLYFLYNYYQLPLRGANPK